MAENLFENVEPLSQILRHLNRYDEDFIDRLNHKFTPILFCIFGIAVVMAQYVGERIKCWSPAQFPDAWIDYTNSICWISNTYYIPMSQNDIMTAPRKEIVYYQWVAVVFFLQAFAFYLPYAFWYVLSKSIGININKIIQNLRQQEQVMTNCRDPTVEQISKHVDRALMYTKDIRTGCCSSIRRGLARYGCFCGKRQGNFLLVIYIITKVLYFGNSITQIYLMNHFLGTDYMFYGVDVLRDLATTGEFKSLRRFPRVTLCDFEVRSIGRNIPYTVQCALPINLFNEKIFIFVWFWLALMVLVNFCGIVHWLWIVFAANRRRYVKTFLSLRHEEEKRYNRAEEKHILLEFCDKYLRQDGHFILRMIAKNTNEVTVGEFIGHLWDEFKEKKKSPEQKAADQRAAKKKKLADEKAATKKQIPSFV